MKRKKHSLLRKDCQAVSEVMGQILMMSIVVLAFSSIGITIFSDVVVDPPHTPHVDLQEKIDTNTDTVWILHSGGEAVDSKEINVILSINGNSTPPFDRSEFMILNSDGSPSNNGILTLGDFIEIDTTQQGINLKDSDTVDMYFVHTPSQQVIQRVTLQKGN